MSNFSSALINQFLLLGYWYWTKLWNLRCHEATLDMRDRGLDMLAILPALVSTLARGAALWLAAGPLLGSVPCTCHLSSSHTPQILWIHLYIYSSSKLLSLTLNKYQGTLAWSWCFFSRSSDTMQSLHPYCQSHILGEDHLDLAKLLRIGMRPKSKIYMSNRFPTANMCVLFKFACSYCFNIVCLCCTISAPCTPHHLTLGYLIKCNKGIMAI